MVSSWCNGCITLLVSHAITVNDLVYVKVNSSSGVIDISILGLLLYHYCGMVAFSFVYALSFSTFLLYCYLLLLFVQVLFFIFYLRLPSHSPALPSPPLLLSSARHLFQPLFCPLVLHRRVILLLFLLLLLPIPSPLRPPLPLPLRLPTLPPPLQRHELPALPLPPAPNLPSPLPPPPRLPATSSTSSSSAGSSTSSFCSPA